VDKQLDTSGLATKRWVIKARAFGDVGMLLVALAGTPEHVFLGRDGPLMQDRSQAAAGVSLYDASIGRPLDFPFGKPTLILSRWDPATATPDGDAPLFMRKPTGDFGPHEVRTNLIDLAVSGDLLYVSLYRENKVVAFNWKIGEPAQEFPIPRPAGIEIDAAGRLLAATPEGIVRVDPATGQRTVLGAGHVLHP